jgi:hypothetical protein
MSERSASVTFEREDRHGRFEVTARATIRRVPITDANREDWRRLIDAMLAHPTPRSAS